MLLDPRNGPDFDLPPPSAPRRFYLIASSPRTGSTLLCRALWDSGLAGAPKEYLNPMQLRDWEVRLGDRASRLRHRALSGPFLAGIGGTRWPEARIAQHLRRVISRRTGANGWFGLKIHYHHLQRWLPDPEATLGAPIRWIRVERDDEIAQAVSWYRALQTGQWTSGQRRWLPPLYHRGQITGRLRQIRRQREGWDRWFAQRGLSPFVIRYEDLATELHAEVKRALSHLGVEGPLERSPPSLRRQSDPLSAEWIHRYRSGR